MFSVKGYVKSGVWQNNAFLVNPITAVKKCVCCNRPWYSIEFADHDEFDDGKYPVCNRCSRKKKHKDVIAGLLVPHIATCSSCKQVRGLESFIARSSDWVVVGRRCEVCRLRVV